MKYSDIRFALPGASWDLCLAAPALSILDAHAQSTPSAREAVGQLFSRDLTQRSVVVERATVLPTLSSRFASLVFDPKVAAAERQRLFGEGLHCVGIWHSHPEPIPSPSRTDRELMRNHSLAVRGQLTGMVFAIVGTSPFPNGLTVMVDDGTILRTALATQGTVKPRASETDE